ncbi:MAG: LarC family nickel insertion protein [Deltaproteobacteria bacterium]|nr:LarC family nickel insertion protein [Deltaproteobacteria bacterium]
MPIAYFDCFSGVAGDMLNAAMLDAGLPLKYLKSELKKLGLSGFDVLAHKESRKKVLGTLYHVDIRKPFSHHNPKGLQNIIEKSKLSPDIKTSSLTVINTILKAQKKVFRLKQNELYFDAESSVDLLVDVVGAIVGFDYFRFDEIFASPLPMHRCYHADVVEILKGMPLEKTTAAQQMVTPTGAAILKTVVTHFGESPIRKIEATGYGCGHKKFDSHPNVLRLLIGEGFKAVMLEANIDDMNPQWFDYVLEHLFEIGVVDVVLEPIQMKKNRPGTLLKAICPWDLKEKAMEIILRETTTLGIRYFPVERRILTREIKTTQTRFGKISVKVARDTALGILKYFPEYEECRKIAKAKKVPLRTVYDEVFGKIRESQFS